MTTTIETIVNDAFDSILNHCHWNEILTCSLVSKMTREKVIEYIKKTVIPTLNTMTNIKRISEWPMPQVSDSEVIRCCYELREKKITWGEGWRKPIHFVMYTIIANYLDPLLRFNDDQANFVPQTMSNWMNLLRLGVNGNAENANGKKPLDLLIEWIETSQLWNYHGYLKDPQVREQIRERVADICHRLMDAGATLNRAQVERLKFDDPLWNPVVSVFSEALTYNPGSQ